LSYGPRKWHARERGGRQGVDGRRSEGVGTRYDVCTSRGAKRAEQSEVALRDVAARSERSDEAEVEWGPIWLRQMGRGLHQTSKNQLFSMNERSCLLRDG
jgi:hypothetical protein